MNRFTKALRIVTNFAAAGASIYLVMSHIGGWSQMLSPVMRPDSHAWSMRVMAATIVLLTTLIFTENGEQPWASLALWPFCLAVGGAAQFVAAGAGALLFNPLPLSIGMTILTLICLALMFIVAVVATGFGIAFGVQWATSTATEKTVRLVRFVRRVVTLVKADNLVRAKAQS